MIPEAAVEAVKELLERETGVPVYTGTPQSDLIPMDAVEAAVKLVIDRLADNELGYVDADDSASVVIDVRDFDLKRAITLALEAALPRMASGDVAMNEILRLIEAHLDSVRSEAATIALISRVAWLYESSETRARRPEPTALVATEEELNALPVGSVVLSDEVKHHAGGWAIAYQRWQGGDWHRGGRSASTHPDNFLPATVLHRG